MNAGLASSGALSRLIGRPEPGLALQFRRFPVVECQSAVCVKPATGSRFANSGASTLSLLLVSALRLLGERWAGYDISDSLIDQALVEMKSLGAVGPRVLAIERAKNGVTLSMKGRPELTMVLQAKGSGALPEAVWTNFVTNQPAGGDFRFFDSFDPQHHNRVYRLLFP